jgi:hypothetical protein
VYKRQIKDDPEKGIRGNIFILGKLLSIQLIYIKLDIPDNIKAIPSI